MIFSRLILSPLSTKSLIWFIKTVVDETFFIRSRSHLNFFKVDKVAIVVGDEAFKLGKIINQTCKSVSMR